jgi:hypothetical protein
MPRFVRRAHRGRHDPRSPRLLRVTRRARRWQAVAARRGVAHGAIATVTPWWRPDGRAHGDDKLSPWDAAALIPIITGPVAAALAAGGGGRGDAAATNGALAAEFRRDKEGAAGRARPLPCHDMISMLALDALSALTRAAVCHCRLSGPHRGSADARPRGSRALRATATGEMHYHPARGLWHKGAGATCSGHIS